MVHALESITGLLTPDGSLIDIHPVRTAPHILVHQGDKLLFSEADPGYDTDDSIARAEHALEEVLHRGIYRVEGDHYFDVITHASSGAELRDYWEDYGAFEDEPQDEAITAQQRQAYARADEVLQRVPGAEITYHERARIMRLRPVAEGQE